MKLQRKSYRTRSKMERDLGIGVLIFLALNMSLVGIGFALGALSVTDFGTVPFVGRAVNPILSLLPFLLNVGLIVFFAFWRSRIALGMLIPFSFLLVLALCWAVVVGVAGAVGSGCGSLINSGGG